MRSVARPINAIKLTSLARDVTGEGWRWVEILPEIDYTTLSHYERRRPERKELSESTLAELDALASEYDELAETDDDNAERLQAIEERIEEINDAAEFWPAETFATAGALVALDHDGGVRVERDLSAPETNAPKARRQSRLTARAKARERRLASRCSG